jgi:hypothetical protein
MNVLFGYLGQFRSQSKNLSLDEAVISWRGPLKCRTYIAGKITNYGEMVRKVCEVVSGYICSMEIYCAEGKNLEDKMLSLLDKNLCQNHHIYPDNF